MHEVVISQFVELIQDQGCDLRETIKVGDEIIHKVLSRNKTRRVTINATDETMHVEIANSLLVLLELEDLISTIPTI